MDELFGGCGLVLLVIIALGTMWWGCSNGKAAAERNFTSSEDYRTWVDAKATAEKRIDDAEANAAERVAEAERCVKEAQAANAALEREVAFKEQQAIPTDDKEEVKFSDTEKKGMEREFERWARNERGERWEEAQRRKQVADAESAKARRRLEEIDRSWLSKIKVSRPNDKIYKACDDKAKAAQKEHDRIVDELRDEFFKEKVDEAVASIENQYNAVKPRIERAKQNAKQLSKDAEEQHSR